MTTGKVILDIISPRFCAIDHGGGQQTRVRVISCVPGAALVSAASGETYPVIRLTRRADKYEYRRQTNQRRGLSVCVKPCRHAV